MDKVEMELQEQVFLTNDIISSDWININTYKINSSNKRFNILDFFNSSYYDVDFPNPKIKENPGLDYLRPIFIGSKLKTSNFKRLSYTELCKYLLNYTSDIDEWGKKMHHNFLNIFEKIKPYLHQKHTYYLLDKED